MKKLISIFLCAAILFACGCTSGYMDQTQGDAISPVQDSTVSTASTVMPLYFRYYDEPMLLRCPLNIEITQQEQAEYYAISALLSKPFGQRPEITYCFKSETKLVEVESDGDYLYVTLSDGFYNDTKGTTEEETRLNRSLAIYSIVNTVCEMGSHTFVQIYIEQGGTALRPDSYQMGLAKNAADTAPLGPLSRNTALLLTPSNVVKAGLSYYSNHEWGRLYNYLGDKDSATVTLPLVEEMAEKFNYLGLMMSEFSVEDNYTVSEDGKTAIVQVSFKIRTENASFDMTNVPLELVYKSRAWLISYESLLHRLGVEE